MENPASYILSAYSFINEYPLDRILEVGYRSKGGNPIPSFDEQLLIELCSEAEQIFSKDDNILEINGDVVIVGDIHGSLHDLLRILKFIQEQNAKVIFLGDYVDRGNFSLECITILYALKVTQPDRFFLIRGNHEFDSVCSIYGFKDEILNYHNPKMPSIPVQTDENSKIAYIQQSSSQFDYCQFNSDIYCYKYTENLYKSFIRSFSYLPIAAKLNSTTLCIHGGLSPKLVHIDRLNDLIKRPIDSLEENPVLSDLVWSDPTHLSKRQFDENPRGRGCIFNREAVSNFLKASNLNRIIRGHQCVKKGIQKNFNSQCITVFSASSYDSKLGNSSSVLQLFQSTDTTKSTEFKPLERLEKCDAIFYKVQSRITNKSPTHVYFSLLHPRLISSINDRSPFSNKKGRKIQPHRSENSISSFYGNTNVNKPLNLVRPKFTTNQRKSLQFLTVKKQFISPLSRSENDYSPTANTSDGNSENQN